MKKFKAGKIINSGTFGCVISPAFQCKNVENLEDKVTKIYKSTVDPEYVNEYTNEVDSDVIKLLRKIDPEEKYTLYATDDRCSLEKINDLSEENIQDIKECLIQRTKPDVKRNHPIDNINNLKNINDINYFFLPKGRRITENDYLDAEYLFNSLKFLHNHGLYHNDFHSGNVILSTKDNLPRIIDFGRAVILNKNLPKDQGRILYYSASDLWGLNNICQRYNIINKNLEFLDAYTLLFKPYADRKWIPEAFFAYLVNENESFTFQSTKYYSLLPSNVTKSQFFRILALDDENEIAEGIAYYRNKNQIVFSNLIFELGIVKNEAQLEGRVPVLSIQNVETQRDKYHLKHHLLYDLSYRITRYFIIYLDENSKQFSSFNDKYPFNSLSSLDDFQNKLITHAKEKIEHMKKGSNILFSIFFKIFDKEINFDLCFHRSQQNVLKIYCNKDQYLQYFRKPFTIYNNKEIFVSLDTKILEKVINFKDQFGYKNLLKSKDYYFYSD